MKLKIRTQPIETRAGDTSSAGFSVVVENADTGEVLPYVQKVVLDMSVDNFATATITVSGVQVESEIFVSAAMAGIVSRPTPKDLWTHGAIDLG